MENLFTPMCADVCCSSVYCSTNACGPGYQATMEYCYTSTQTYSTCGCGGVW
jgi:hypothetical protein